MKKVIVFFNNHPPELLTVLMSVTSIRKVYPDGSQAHLKILPTNLHLVFGSYRIIFIASDKPLRGRELMEAASRLNAIG
ncbi:hypothetical protein VOF77_23105 [Leclercia adecarboxylata]|uniref:Uncharacterized protein n=1 Tax=Leclercia adecarboxylata TaxID=83655 RepID=A0ABU6ICD9_9ENTR|nr:hypothetical protein [Leclercia adecarboxylata]MEC3905170.1 hypothetical protein [Leclercia adecarboxylata]MEC3939233.1 hypothetical protein [Leclercia adecarboxylata]QFH52916.1 hypothetical protein FR819_27465 [Leclercia adecarboxylata]